MEMMEDTAEKNREKPLMRRKYLWTADLSHGIILKCVLTSNRK